VISCENKINKDFLKMKFFVILLCFNVLWMVSCAPLNSFTKKSLRNNGIDDFNADKLVSRMKYFILHRMRN